MAWPTASARTKNWGTELLYDTDVEAQLDLLHTYFNDSLNGTTGHGHTGTTNDGPKLSIASALTIGSQAQGDIIYASSASAWARLGAGTSGKYLKTQGAAANPTWDTPVPSGVIVMWSGTIASIPTGWVLCDGSNSTPDLRNRFIVAADADDSGVAKSTITGSALQSHDTGVMPAHTHSVTVLSGGSGLGNGGNSNCSTSTTGSTGTGTKVIAVFYALAFIMKS